MPTDFNKILYDDASHTYAYNSKPLMSVTTLVKHLVPEFDRDGLSARSAAKQGVSQEEILRKWEEASIAGRERGTRLHQYIEDSLVGKVDPVLRVVNKRIPEMDAFDAGWNALKAGLNAQVARQEWIIGDEELGVAGRVDCLLAVKPPEGEAEICVFDWKTGRLEVKSNFGYLLPPLQRYDSSELCKYSVQLSLYRLILERNRPELACGNGYLLHLKQTGSYELYRAKDMRKELAAWLKNGVPADVAGDPEADKKLKYATDILDNIDSDVFRNASRHTADNFKVAVAAVASLEKS